MNDRKNKNRCLSLGHSGATLVELLVVLVIFSLLAASAIPMLAPIMSNRQVREGARIVSSTLTGARNRAMQSGRPYAVVLDRLAGLPEASVSLSYAEVPLPYTGDSLSSVVAVSSGLITFIGVPSPSTGPTDPSNSTNVPSTDVGWIGTIRVGDLIRFNNQGSYFQLWPNPIATANSSPQAFYQPPLSTTLNPAPAVGTYTIDPATSVSYHWQIVAVTGTGGLSAPADGFYRFQILRQPVRSAAAGVTLPGSTVIDLNFSGFDVPNQQITQASTLLSAYGYTYSFQPIWPRPGTSGGSGSPLGGSAPDTSSIIIMFAPSGAIDTVWCWGNDSATTQGIASSLPCPIPIPIKPLTPIHLLIGHREFVPLPTSPPHIISPANASAPFDPGDSNFKPYLNWQDMTSLWVSIDNKSGTISTAENNVSATAFNNGGYGVYNGTPGYGSYVEIMESRQLAIEMQRLGGR
ncbi:MAG TPA: prepilin-type N-terminal cleavage/methylation domain-containing protein [Pirellulales bacterium]